MKNFIRISYTGRIKDGRVFDTTDENVAKDEGIYNDKRIYKSLCIIPSEGHVIKGLDEVLETMSPGETKVVEIPPEKAYGMRDPKLLKLVPHRIFKQQKINPAPGMIFELDGKPAKIQTVSGGRVRVDLNSELAGKTVVFDVKVEDVAKTINDRVKYLIERGFNDSDEFEIKITDENKKLHITLPQRAYKDSKVLVRRASFAAEAFKYLDVLDVTFVEVWKNTAPEKKNADGNETGNKKIEKNEEGKEEDKKEKNRSNIKKTDEKNNR